MPCVPCISFSLGGGQVLSDYKSDELDLSDRSVYRDLKKPSEIDVLDVVSTVFWILSPGKRCPKNRLLLLVNGPVVWICAKLLGRACQREPPSFVSITSPGDI